MKIALYTCLALIAFAGNSVLCRLALEDAAMDAGSFTAIRLLSGLAVLLVILKLVKPSAGVTQSKGSWKAAFFLFVYALAFSFAYLSLETGVGALILFGAVQITMILVSLASGYRLHGLEWLGVLVAFAGFVYLVLPDLATPTFTGFVLMAVSGIAWGFYTLAGKNSENPLADTAYNFLRCMPLVVVLVALTYQEAALSPRGVLLAVVSGGVTSGIGYAIWYAAMGGLSALQAAVLQLLVPVLAAAGGVVFASEGISLRLLLSSALVLGGILVVILGKQYGSDRSRRCD
ncbi:DMT family transporter [Porticoccus sp. W117]|uniref:DMT family transporter n=1 Tax=Porticoccus sp. W117 TaxID=3054777 RepID=UPI002596AAEB|nr:DMT family transporter [Porticoccus sp. W117]MDM3871743.1 DMT family transporter [Porticoccus sp. W117]